MTDKTSFRMHAIISSIVLFTFIYTLVFPIFVKEANAATVTKITTKSTITNNLQENIDISAAITEINSAMKDIKNEKIRVQLRKIIKIISTNSNTETKQRQLRFVKSQILKLIKQDPKRVEYTRIFNKVLSRVYIVKKTATQTQTAVNIPVILPEKTQTGVINTTKTGATTPIITSNTGATVGTGTVQNTTTTQTTTTNNTVNQNTSNVQTQPVATSDSVVICKTGCAYSTENTSLNKLIRTILDSRTSQSRFTFYIQPGTYDLDGSITINKDNISIIGSGGRSVTTLIGKQGTDVIGWHAANGIFEDVTVNAKQNGSQTAFSASADKLRISNVTFYGAAGQFVVFLAGPSHGAGLPYDNPNSAYHLYESNNLHSGIILEGIQVYGNFWGDNLVIALTNGAALRNSRIEGKCSFYLSKNGIIENNTFANTPSDGLYISGPVDTVVVRNNSFSQIGGSAIAIKNQVEHPMPANTVSKNITLEGNTIQNTKYFGIVGGSFVSSKIQSNTIRNTGGGGIYISGNSTKSTNNISITNNTIENVRLTNDSAYSRVWGAGIGLESVKDISVSGNVIQDTLPESRLIYGIYTKDDNENIGIVGNTITKFTGADIIR